MNRQDLIDAVAEDTEASRAATTRFLDSLITIAQNEVAKSDTVKLIDSGIFEKTTIAVCTGRNPKTGAPVKIPSTHKSESALGATFKGLVKD